MKNYKFLFRFTSLNSALNEVDQQVVGTNVGLTNVELTKNNKTVVLQFDGDIGVYY